MKSPLDCAALDAAMENVHRAGMPGLFAEVRDGDQVWRGAAGVADVVTGRPVDADMRHRVAASPRPSPPPRSCSRPRVAGSVSTHRSAGTFRSWFPENAVTRSRSGC